MSWNISQIRYLWHFPIELLCSVVPYAILLKRRNYFGLRFIASFILMVVSICACLFMVKSELESNLWEILRYSFWCFLIFSDLIIGVLLSFETDVKEAVYCVTCAYLTEHIAYCVRILTNFVTQSNLADADTWFYILIHVAIYILSYYIFAKKMIKEKHYATSMFQSLGLMLSVVSLVIIMSMISSMLKFEWIHAIYALFCCLFALYSQVKQLEQLNLQKELNKKEQLWMKHRAQYEMSKENIDIINRKCHDLKHQIAALRKINSQEKQEEVINSIENSIMIYDSIYDTGNEILDTVLTEKGLICNEKKISMSCMIDGKLLNFMDPIDLYTLFGNALDNAIESVLKLDDTNSHYLSLFVHEKMNLILIKLENPCREEVKFKNGYPITDKQDRGFHGFGVKSIVQIAEIYGGIVTFDVDRDMFVLKITIPKAII